MSNVLYISLTGMTEALGESQVMQYLLDLSDDNNIYLLSFEKTNDKAKLLSVKAKLSEAGIQWHYFPYSNRFGVVSTLWQISAAFILLARLVRRKDIEVIHARSLIPAVIGLLLKTISRSKLLFDIRGFAIDEKIYEGRLGEKSLLTKILKRIELHTYRHADHIVTLTHVSKPILIEKSGLDSDKITVIPTCASAALFKPASHEEKIRLKRAFGYAMEDKIVLHNGTVNSWVDFSAELKLYKSLALLEPNIHFLFLNQGQHDHLNSEISKYHIDPMRYRVLSVDFSRVADHIKISDVCVFFVKPCSAKQASAPTKFAELVACHVHSVTNKNYGDMEYYLDKYPVGLTFSLEDIHTSPSECAVRVYELLTARVNAKWQPEKFDELFYDNFSKEIAIKKYQSIYNSITGGTT